MTDAGARGSPSVVLTRPAALISDVAQGLVFVARVANETLVAGSSSSVGQRPVRAVDAE